MQRMLNAEQVCAYLGLSESGLRDWVKKKRIPGPNPGTKRYDLRAIDMALDRASGIAECEKKQASPYDDWKSGRGS